MKEQRKFIRWIKAHKKALIITGISIGTLIAIVLGIKNREAILEVWASLKEVVEKPAKKALKAPLTEQVVKAVPAITVIPTAEQALNEAIPVVEEGISGIGKQGYSFPFEVSRHLRNLSDGRQASPEKVAAALEKNIVLKEGQTWVEAYTKGAKAT